jgi:lysozyme
MNLDLLSPISVPTPLENLNVAEVRELQAALSSLGYGLNSDGILGPLTKSVWARFKADNSLDQPDLIGPGSVALLTRRLNGAGTGEVPQQALNLVKTFEGYRATAYQDGVGVWTIGYGTTKYPDGKAVASGDTVTAAQAEAYLTGDILSTVKTLASSIPYWSTMNADQKSALISFGYNLGAGFYGASGFNSITSALANHRWSDVPRVMTLYSDPEDPTDHPGLLRRRIAEGDLWQGTGTFAATA